MPKRKAPPEKNFHTWEAPERHAWEEDPGSGCDDDGDGEEEVPSGEAAGKLLSEFVLQLQMGGMLSARALCIICYYASQAGAKGCGDLAFAPGKKSTGHYQRHIDVALGVDMHDKSLFRIWVPYYNKHDCSRTVRQTPVQPPHERIHDEMTRRGSTEEDVRQLIGEQGFGQQYHNHDVVRDSTHPVIPVAIYVDGVRYLRREGLVGFWVVNMVTHVRHVVAVVRRSRLCQCGCGGWCSVWAILSFLQWSLTAGARGQFPDRDMHGVPWADDDHRKTLIGPLQFAMAVLQIKGDWAEFAHTLGFASWSTARYPCMFCHAEKTNWHDMRGVSLLMQPWPSTSPEQYEEACGLCEHVRVINSHEHRLIRVSLVANKNKDGPRGRALIRDLPALGLLAGDRLEPSKEVPDVYGYDHVSDDAFPLKVTFWRRSRETMVRHRCPLFSVPGVNMLSVMIDVLHTMHLGVANAYVAHVLWELLLADLYGIGGREDHRIQSSVLRLRTSLWDWYRSVPATQREEITKVNEFSVDMLGSKHHRFLTTKAMEIKGLVGWVVHLLRRRGVVLGANADCLLQAGEQLLRWFTIVKGSPNDMSHLQLQQMCDAGVRHINLAKLGGVHMLPKHHLFIHLLRGAVANGNPRFYATFRDEGANRVLAAVARSAYAAVWEQRIYSNFDRLEPTKANCGC
jgi:hypothetical protein